MLVEEVPAEESPGEEVLLDDPLAAESPDPFDAPVLALARLSVR